VENGLTDATMFLPTGEVVQPAEALYKKPVLLLRGSFDPVMNLHLAMLEQAQAGFSGSLAENERAEAIELCEFLMHNLLRGPGIDPVDFIDRADALQSLGKTVLVSRCAEFHRIAAFLNRCTNQARRHHAEHRLAQRTLQSQVVGQPGGWVVGILRSFVQAGSDLASVSRGRTGRPGELVTAETFQAPENCVHLYRHFVETGRIQAWGWVIPVCWPTQGGMCAG
jgi:hypothetical protein